MRKRDLWRVQAAGLLLSALLTGLMLGGCISGAPQATDDASARAAIVQDADRRLAPGDMQHYEFDVSDGVLDVTALADGGGEAQLLLVTAPDGRTWRPLAADSLPFDVETATAAEGTGFRMIVREAETGVWRIGVGAVHADALAALLRQARDRSFIENFLLMLYVLNGRDGGPLDAALGGFLRGAFPALEAAGQTVTLTVLRNTGEDAGQPGDGDGDGNQNGNGDGDGNSNSNVNGNGNGGNANDNSNSNSNANSNSNSNSNSNANSNGNSNNNGNSNGNNNGTPPASIALEAIARSGDAVPGQPAAARFVAFGNPVLDNDGRIAFWARYRNGNGDGGLFFWDGNELKAAVNDDPNSELDVPGADANAFFGDLNIRYDSGAPGITWGRDGRLLFLSPVQSPYPIGIYRYRVDDGDLLRVADMRQLSTSFGDALPNTFSAELFNPVIDDNNIAAFTTRYTFIAEGPQFVTGRTGLFTSNGVALTPVVDNQLSDPGVVPNQSSSAYFDVVDARIAVSREGVLMFQSTYRSGAGNRGVYLLADGELVRALDNATNRSFTGLPLGAQVNGGNVPFEAIAIGEGVRLAVDTTLTVNGQTRSAVLLWNGERWRELTAVNGAPSTDLLSGVSDDGEVIFFANDRPHIARANSNQDLTGSLSGELISQNIEWQGSGGAINSRGHALVRYGRTDSQGTLVSDGIGFWNGERMLVGADPTLQTALRDYERLFMLMRPESNRVGRSGPLNERDEFVFRAATDGADNAADTDDDVQAIFLGTAFTSVTDN